MLFLGDLPKPIHGMSVMNEKYLQFLVPNIVINTAPSSFFRYFDSWTWKIFKLVLSFGVLVAIFWARFKGERVCYRALNGGSGQIIDILYLGVLRTLGFRIFIHHHSFSYLRSRSLLFSILNFVAGSKATHIVLGERMKLRLKTNYNIEEARVLVISNSVFFSPSSENFSQNSVPVMGYLANLTIEKGLGVFVDICLGLKERGIVFDAVIAGPISGPGVEEKLQEFKAVGGRYLGPVYDESKRDFFRSLDFFVFPSQYRNEAEPLVLYEAAQYGAHIVVSDIGCLSDVATSVGGTVLSDSDRLVADAIAELSSAFENGHQCSKIAVTNKLSEHISGSIRNLELLRRRMKDASES